MQSRVDAGVAFLSEKKPGWFEHTDLGALEISSCTSCVVGQVTGVDYEVGLGFLDISASEASALGFSRHFDDEVGTFSVLTELWRTTIEKLRAEAGTLGAQR